MSTPLRAPPRANRNGPSGHRYAPNTGTFTSLPGVGTRFTVPRRRHAGDLGQRREGHPVAEPQLEPGARRGRGGRGGAHACVAARCPVVAPAGREAGMPALALEGDAPGAAPRARRVRAGAGRRADRLGPPRMARATRAAGSRRASRPRRAPGAASGSARAAPRQRRGARPAPRAGTPARRPGPSTTRRARGRPRAGARPRSSAAREREPAGRSAPSTQPRVKASTAGAATRCA